MDEIWFNSNVEPNLKLAQDQLTNYRPCPAFLCYFYSAAREPLLELS